MARPASCPIRRGPGRRAAVHCQKRGSARREQGARSLVERVQVPQQGAGLLQAQKAVVGHPAAPADVEERQPRAVHSEGPDRPVRHPFAAAQVQVGQPGTGARQRLNPGVRDAGAALRGEEADPGAVLCQLAHPRVGDVAAVVDVDVPQRPALRRQRAQPDVRDPGTLRQLQPLQVWAADGGQVGIAEVRYAEGQRLQGVAVLQHGSGPPGGHSSTIHEIQPKEAWAVLHDGQAASVCHLHTAARHQVGEPAAPQHRLEAHIRDAGAPADIKLLETRTVLHKVLQGCIPQPIHSATTQPLQALATLNKGAEPCGIADVVAVIHGDTAQMLTGMCHSSKALVRDSVTTIEINLSKQRAALC
mmetsp:Transcript_9017/g.16018  ORF Transcript_9017/g.16018 Transcript_9017/m.16018 type:complete len:360 (+) Transcript_9017:309-1388(+)